ncbi:tripartite motif-containing protein 16-like [Garra rufa]|uniref:tripartite motif-containing protein 16-like n=1 Tax=Garra rufa TaxID=137080 RepID=UPI003CCEAF29
MEKLNSLTFNCPVCLDLLEDPVAIPCGHSYCMSCITDHWNQEDQKRVYSCPKCRQTFSPRPALGKNTMLAEVVEQLKRNKLPAVPAGAEDVECDFCTERKHKAVKSCLVCVNSYCQNHLEQHEDLFKEKEHNLMDATRRIKEMLCCKHEKPLDIYCRTNQSCICMLCMVDEHRNHEAVSTAAERVEKQKELVQKQAKFQQQIQQREKIQEKVKEAVENHKHSAQTAVEDSERILPELIRAIEKKCSEMAPMIRAREKIVVSQAEELLKRLEQETDDLRGTNAKLEQLLHTRDHTHFLQTFPSLPVPPGSPDVPRITDGSFDGIGDSVSQLRQKLEDFCSKEIAKISGQMTCIQIIPTPEYSSRTDFLQYFQNFTLDPNTAHQRLYLSEEYRKVTYNTTLQYADHPDRFSYWWQVLCRESVSGRGYWEVEWDGRVDVYVSVAYKSISRKGWGYECAFGSNDQSWSLVCSPSKCSFWHSNSQTVLPVPSTSKIGVYVDHSAGILSFYSISDTMTLIHRVQTAFTQPLCPGFGINCTTGDGIRRANRFAGRNSRWVWSNGRHVNRRPDNVRMKQSR